MSTRPEALKPPDFGIHKTGSNRTGASVRQQMALIQHYGLRPDGDLLEIGCGVGRLAYELAVLSRPGYVQRIRYQSGRDRMAQ